MGMLLMLSVACNEPEGYDAYRERTAQYGNRHLQNEQGLFHQRKGEHALSLRWYIAAGTPTNHIVKSKETAVDIVSRYTVFLKVIKNDPGNQSVDFDNLKADDKIIIPGLPTAMYNAGRLTKSIIKSWAWRMSNKPCARRLSGISSEPREDWSWRNFPTGTRWSLGWVA